MTAWGLSPSCWGVRFSVKPFVSVTLLLRRDRNALTSRRSVSRRVRTQSQRTILESAAWACSFLGGIK